MKKVLIVIALAAFTTGFAQKNKNTKKETVITKEAVKSTKGVDVSEKTKTVTSKQAMTLEDSDANKTNQNVVMKPIEVDTEVSYGYDGNRFQFINQKDEDGYRMMTVRDNASKEEYAIIKPTTQNGYYILSKDGTSSFGYFNEDGNFVVERYDAKNDAVVSDVYKLQMNKDLKKE
ncbi:hypothetical protein [Aequorivita marina]|uniref:hypothetical protein n=1 Tax=Aequorivita marina TaxID=3073654 RepID=UPI0028750F28|nr:hypothetical protein [Aequorivita sp. S2608]MDS1297619.1 hypothetical protein [Aequorivita sp. S2608]